MPEVLFNNKIENLLVNPTELFDTYINNNDNPEFILVVPTGKQVRKYKNEFVIKYHDATGKPVKQPKIYTFNTFVQKIISSIEKFNEIVFITETYRLELFEQAVRSSNTEYFFRNVNREKELNRNLLDRLAKIIFGLKTDGIKVHKIKEELDNKDENIKNFKRYKDIYEIFKNYQELTSTKYPDHPDALELLNREMTPDEKQISFFDENYKIDLVDDIFKDIEQILFHGFTEFNVPEIKFLNNLAKSNVNLLINLDYNSNNGPIFGNLRNAVTALIGNYRSKIFPDSIEDPKKAYLREYLFDAEIKFYKKDLDDFQKSDLLNNKLEILAAKDKKNEVTSIAKLVKHLIIIQNYKAYEICIASRRADQYSSHFREEFKKHAIPANISDRFNLERSGPIITIISFLNIINDNFSIQDLIKVIFSPYLNWSLNYAELNDKNNLQNVLISSNISTNIPNLKFDSIIDRLKKRKVTLDNIIEEIELEQFSDDFEKRTKHDQRNAIISAIYDLNTIKEALNKISEKSMTPLEFSESIKQNIIKDFGMKWNIKKKFNYLQENSAEISKIDYFINLDEIEKESRAIVTFEKLLDEMSYLLKERYGAYKPKISELLNKLIIMVSAAKYQINEKQNFGVNITSVEQTRGFDYKILILCGATDGEFPLAYSPEKFLGKELKDTELRHFNSERMLFYQFLTNSTETIKYYLFYPKSKEDKEQVRSQFIDSLSFVTQIDSVIDLTDSDQLPDWYKAITTESEIQRLMSKSSKIENSSKNNFSNINFIKHFENYSNLIQLNELNETAVRSIPSKESRDFSVSELETYIDCPFKYFLSKILYLDEEVSEIQFLDSAETGSILHKILQLFYLEMQKEQSSLNPENINVQYEYDNLPYFQQVKLDVNKKDHYLYKLSEIADKQFDGIDRNSIYYEFELREFFGTSNRKGKLEHWLDTELDRIEKGWNLKPALFELEFNKRKTIKSVLLKDFKLKGKIDRIEFFNDDDGIYFLIADYKSGESGTSNNKEIVNGIKFQMPLYIAAAKEILQSQYNIKTQNIGAVYYIINFSKKEQHQFVLITNNNILDKGFIPKRSRTIKISSELEDNTELIKKVIDQASDTIGKIEQGVFNVIPRNDDICKYCNYQSVCRIKELTKEK